MRDFSEVMRQRYAGARVRKLGEGSFKEVFLCGNDVVSVIPIEGDIVINDQKQPSALKILPELVAHMELSRLRQPTAPYGDPSGEFRGFGAEALFLFITAKRTAWKDMRLSCICQSTL